MNTHAQKLTLSVRKNNNQFPQLKFCVTFFQIVKLDGGALSPRFQTHKQAVNALGSILSMDAVISEQTFMFHEENDAGRDELLAEIVAVGGAS